MTTLSNMLATYMNRSLPARVVRRVKALGHVNWALSDQALVSAVNFLTTILVARMVSLEAFGVFSIAWMIILLSKDLQNAAINAPMMSIGPKHSTDELPDYYGAAILQQLIFTTASIGLILLGSAIATVFYPKMMTVGFIVALTALVGADQLQDFVRRYLYANERPAAALVNDLVNSGSRLALLLLMFAYFPADVITVLWVMTGCAMAGVGVGALTIGTVRFSRAWMKSIALRNWQFSKWMSATSILRWLSSNLIILVSGGVLGPQVVGAIRAAINVMAPRNVLILGLSNVALVRGARKMQSDGTPGLRLFLSKILALGLAFDLSLSIGAAVFADKIMLYLYGPEFVPYSFIIYWLACINIVHFLAFTVGIGLQILEHTRPFFTSALIEAAFGLAASYALVAWFGLTGTLAGLAVTNTMVLACLAPPLIKRLRS